MAQEDRPMLAAFLVMALCFEVGVAAGLFAAWVLL
jgi:hypothetical protein